MYYTLDGRNRFRVRDVIEFICQPKALHLFVLSAYVSMIDTAAYVTTVQVSVGSWMHARH